MTRTFKKLSYEKKLGLYFSLLTSLILKYFRPEFQVNKSKKSRKWCYFLKGTVTTSLLSACQIFAECKDNP